LTKTLRREKKEENVKKVVRREKKKIEKEQT